MSRSQTRSTYDYLLKQAGVTLIYALFAFLNLYYFPLIKFAAIPYLASGFAVAVLLLWGAEYVLGIFFGALLAHTLADISGIILLASVVGTSAQALFGYYIFDFYCKKKNTPTSLKSINDYVVFVVLVCLISTLIRPVCVSAALFVTDTVTQDFLFERVMTFWLGDVVGCIVLAPLILQLSLTKWSLPSLRNFSFASIWFFICFIVGQIVFFGWFKFELADIAKPYWLFLLTPWIAIIFEAKITSFFLFLIATQSFLGTVLGLGTFGEDIVLTGLSNYSFFIFILSLVSMMLAFYANEQVTFKSMLQIKVNELQLKEQALDAISQGVLITDVKHQTTYINRAFQDLTGYSAHELIGKSYEILHGDNSSPAVIRQIKDGFNRGHPFLGEILNYRKDGSSFWNELSISPVVNSTGDLTQFVSVQHDITYRKFAESEAALAKAVFENNPNGIAVTDVNKNILMVNPSFLKITGYDPAEIIGKNPSILSSGRHDKAFYADMWKEINEKHQWEGEIWNCRKNGEIYPEWLTISTVFNHNNEITNYIGMFVDLTQHKKAEADIQRLVHFDVLTGLPNLIFMQSQGERELSFARVNQTSLAVLFIDLDHFKYVNDTLGHHIGDLLLIEVSKRFQCLLREGDVLSRQGGDEFVVLLPGASEKGASHVARKILDATLDPFVIEHHTLNIATSIGVALYPRDGHDFEELSKCADTALFHAKEHGRNNVQFFDHKMSNEVLARVRLESALHLAVADEQFDVHYQALTDLQSGKITGFEALIRWVHPELGQISPAQFIPVAEECGVINAIGAWVLNRVCQDIRRWIDIGLSVPQIAINFSPRQFRDPNLIAHIQDALARYQLTTSALCIEITEGVLMENAHVSQITLMELKQLGVTLSLDDFGTGYSSLSYLKLFPFDKVKIDQSFVREITTNTQDAAIVIAVIGMAHSLGIRVLAEGVETEEQCAFLRNNMSDEIQGYFFSKPIPAEAAEALIREDRQLPAHLLRLSRPEKTLLLVDDEQNIVSSLKRLLRRDGYQILTANSGQEGLDVLRQNKVDVIISDQRMPGMTGVEFLRHVKSIYPDTIRIVLSGYTELTSVTDAINEGAVFRFLTKPWDDEKLRDYIKEAFHYKELADDNRQLSLKVQTSNYELAAANRHLADILQQKQKQITRDTLSLEIVREALQHTPVAVIGLDDANVIAFANDAATTLFADVGPILGEELGLILPELDTAVALMEEAVDVLFKINDKYYDIRWRRMGEFSQSSGKVITFSKIEST